jgi:hypothetical protein
MTPEMHPRKEEIEQVYELVDLLISVFLQIVRKRPKSDDLQKMHHVTHPPHVVCPSRLPSAVDISTLSCESDVMQ